VGKKSQEDLFYSKKYQETYLIKFGEITDEGEMPIATDEVVFRRLAA